MHSRSTLVLHCGCTPATTATCKCAMTSPLVNSYYMYMCTEVYMCVMHYLRHCCIHVHVHAFSVSPTINRCTTTWHSVYATDCMYIMRTLFTATYRLHTCVCNCMYMYMYIHVHCTLYTRHSNLEPCTYASILTLEKDKGIHSVYATDYVYIICIYLFHCYIHVWGIKSQGSNLRIAALGGIWTQCSRLKLYQLSYRGCSAGWVQIFYTRQGKASVSTWLTGEI